jgi:hypothetical protein
LAGLLRGVALDLEDLAAAIESDYFRPGAEQALHSYEAL